MPFVHEVPPELKERNARYRYSPSGYVPEVHEPQLSKLLFLAIEAAYWVIVSWAVTFYSHVLEIPIGIWTLGFIAATSFIGYSLREHFDFSGLTGLNRDYTLSRSLIIRLAAFFIAGLKLMGLGLYWLVLKAVAYGLAFGFAAFIAYCLYSLVARS